jgi:hypothetical protein
MKRVRKISLFVLVAFVAVFALSAFTSSAEAGGCHKYYPTYSYGHVHKHIDYHYPVSYWPTYDYIKPISYPVTYYDCYGHPYVVWQTSYSYTP